MFLTLIGVDSRIFGSLCFSTNPWSMQSSWLPQSTRALVVMSFAKVSRRTDVGMMIDLFFGTHFVFLGESCITEDLPFKNPLWRLFLPLLLQTPWFDFQTLVLL